MVDTERRIVENLAGAKVVQEHRDTRFSVVDFLSAELETLELLAAFVRRLKPKIAIECGTYHGIASCYIGDALKQNGSGHLWSIECDEERAVVSREAIRRMDLESVVTVVLGKSVIADVPEGPYDFVFHDGDRDSDLGPELERFSGNLSHGGMSFVHDTSIDGYQHVDPMCRDFVFKNRLNYCNISSSRGLGILQKP